MSFPSLLGVGAARQNRGAKLMYAVASEMMSGPDNWTGDSDVLQARYDLCRCRNASKSSPGAPLRRASMGLWFLKLFLWGFESHSLRHRFSAAQKSFKNKDFLNRGIWTVEQYSVAPHLHLLPDLCRSFDEKVASYSSTHEPPGGWMALIDATSLGATLYMGGVLPLSEKTRPIQATAALIALVR